MFVDDAQVNGGSPQQNAALMNATHEYLKSLDPTDHLLVVTWAYAGGASSSTDAYGAALDKDIEVMWTGNAVEPCTMTASDMAGPNHSYQRTLSIWDNWPAPAVDSGCSVDKKMVGRSNDLPTAIHGYYSNPVINEAGGPLSEELSHLGPIMDFAWGATHYNANVDASYARWAGLLPGWQSIVHPCTNTNCVANGGAFLGFACDASDKNKILFCDQYENHCVTSLRCPKGCTVQANAQDSCL
jgi:hyaluronoglucosaminidase